MGSNPIRPDHPPSNPALSPTLDYRAARDEPQTNLGFRWWNASVAAIAAMICVALTVLLIARLGKQWHDGRLGWSLIPLCIAMIACLGVIAGCAATIRKCVKNSLS